MLNTTFLTLIVEERVSHPNNFWPISFWNVIYKIITNVISLCHKPLISFIISHEKTSYVEGSQIMDSGILVHEVIPLECS